MPVETSGVVFFNFPVRDAAAAANPGEQFVFQLPSCATFPEVVGRKGSVVVGHNAGGFAISLDRPDQLKLKLQTTY
ncbi:MAG: hypothetical protein QNJ61_17630 [Desulfobacterales bacterium]|nr:hypothetical protein [Desulfobacterales bacterium]